MFIPKVSHIMEVPKVFHFFLLHMHSNFSDFEILDIKSCNHCLQQGLIINALNMPYVLSPLEEDEEVASSGSK